MAKTTLLDVKQDFEHWRHARVKLCKIPETLWQKAVALTKDYSISEIVKTLRLSGTAFVHKRQLHGNPTPNEELKQSFAQVQLEFSDPMKPSSCSIELKRQDGASMTIQASSCQIPNIIKSFLGDLHVTNFATK